MTERPLPPIDPWTRPYWEAARAGKLLLQFCPDCSRHIFYPRRYCPSCLSGELEWVQACGRGKVYAFTVVENNAPSAFLGELPFIIAIVRLEEGVQMMTNLVECVPAAVHSEMAVEVVFEKVSETITLPMFKPLVAGNQDGKNDA